MQNELKILYISSEIAPFAKTRNWAGVAGALPRVLKDIGHDIRLFIPKYGSINERRYIIRDVIRLKEIKVPLHNKTVLADIKSAFLPNSKVQVYFVANKAYFDRPGLYMNPETNQQWPDNAERFIFFNRSIFAILRKLHWQPDIIHCNDWQTALIPFYLKTYFHQDPFFNKIQTVLTIHDLSAQGAFDEDILPLIGDPSAIFYPGSPIEYQGKVNFLKAGIVCADFIQVTSKSYAREIKVSEQASYGLKDIIKKRSKNLVGMINGIDYSDWDPEIDPLITHNYTPKELTVKMKNKQELVEQQGLKFHENIPVIAAILNSSNKNELELMSGSIDEIMKSNVQYIMVDKGDNKSPTMLTSLVKKHPDRIVLVSDVDNQLIHKIIAGADLFIFPCEIEPCGSLHLSCLKYGTIPIVYATGMLLDTIKDFDPMTQKGYGFIFQEYKATALAKRIKQALKIYNDKTIWKKIVDRAMKQNFSWQVVVENYNKLYYKLID